MTGPLFAALLLAGTQEYDALLAEGIAAGRAGRLEEARRLLDRAVGLDPARPEALVERGGVDFLEGRYDAAATQLGAALERREDAYARGLLAAALHLAGRPDDALAHWNRLGQPSLRRLTIVGLERTREDVARREITLDEGALVRLAGLRRSRLQLHESGAFDGVRLRTEPRAQGQADVEVALAERSGFARGVLDFAIATGVAAAQGRAPLRYSNLAGEGVALAAEYRWRRNRPQASAAISWPRPLGLGAYLTVEGFRGRQLYEVAGQALGHRRGFELGLRRVLGPATVGGLRLRSLTRRFEGANPLARDGRVQGLEGRLDQRLVQAGRLRLSAGVSLFSASRITGSELDFTRAMARVRTSFEAPPSSAQDTASWTLAAQVTAGIASGAPFDEGFAPGASPEMNLPLRARQQAEDGVMGQTPLSGRLVLVNLEWRQRLWSAGGVQLGVVGFYDGARLGRVYGGHGAAIHDIGFGVRALVPGAGVLRFDLGHGLSDGRNAVSIGLGHVF